MIGRVGSVTGTVVVGGGGAVVVVVGGGGAVVVVGGGGAVVVVVGGGGAVVVVGGGGAVVGGGGAVVAGEGGEGVVGGLVVGGFGEEGGEGAFAGGGGGGGGANVTGSFTNEGRLGTTRPLTVENGNARGASVDDVVVGEAPSVVVGVVEKMGAEPPPVLPAPTADWLLWDEPRTATTHTAAMIATAAMTIVQRQNDSSLLASGITPAPLRRVARRAEWCAR